MTLTPITIAYGDGIGPEIMEAVLKILKAAEAPLSYETIEIGEHIYEKGVMAGIEEGAWKSLKRTRLFLKAPITTPQGKGVKSLNVTIRNTLGLYANIRPCKAYNPFTPTRHPDMDVVIIRENEEDVYGGIEHRQTPDVMQCLKIISRPGTEKIVRFAFEYALAYDRQKVTCLTKDNILKMTDGLFHEIFDEIAKEYPQISANHMIVDIGAARLADTPEQFDVIVVPNLYGDILSDIAAEIAGSVGLVGSANIGEDFAMFEAIHGSAPDIAGKDVANPSGLLMGAIMLLVHIGASRVASQIHNAWLLTLEDGIFTRDIFNPAFATAPVGTIAFTEAVIARLGRKPHKLNAVHYPEDRKQPLQKLRYKRKTATMDRRFTGIDIFVYTPAEKGKELIQALQADLPPNWKLVLVTNRGTKVWPNGHAETFCVDQWRCRFELKDKGSSSPKQIIELLQTLDAKNIEVIKTENLYEFDGKPGYSKGQGE